MDSLVSGAKAAATPDFVELTQKVTHQLLKERKGVRKGLVQLKPEGSGIVIGDLHGDLKSLQTILQKSSATEKLQSKEATMVFLGDYGDRGRHSAEVYHIVLSLKVAYPDQVVLLRGNHEAPRGMMASPHDLPYEFRRHFDDDWEQAYDALWELWAELANAVLVEGQYLMVHGGVSPKIRSIQDLADPKGTMLVDLLWSDPDDSLRGIEASPRGFGHLFGADVTQTVLETLNVGMLIRGHQPNQRGYQLNHGGRVLTLFSCKGAPYHNRYGSYLEVPLAKKYPDSGEFVACCVRRF
ncbi:MAG: serine/threonine protein phosphatase [Candidatus Bathyarchaeota archaeon]|nr:serine/threonine protein phosphatase [Candidatus Bathyarchaeota archaeon]